MEQDTLDRIKETFVYFDKNKEGFIISKDLDDSVLSLGADIRKIDRNKIIKKISLETLIELCSTIEINSSNIDNKLQETLNFFDYKKDVSLSVEIVKNIQ